MRGSVIEEVNQSKILSSCYPLEAFKDKFGAAHEHNHNNPDIFSVVIFAVPCVVMKKSSTVWTHYRHIGQDNSVSIVRLRSSG
jgi:hypothetical protein